MSQSNPTTSPTETTTAQRPRRAGSDLRDPASVSDPGTTDDETRTSLLEWIHTHPYLATILVVLTPIGLGILLFIATRVAPGILGNWWVQRGSAVLFYTGVVVYVARVDQRAIIENVDELDLAAGDSMTTYKGEVEPVPGMDDAWAFVPLRGYTRFGRPGDPLTIEELSPQLAEKHAAKGGDREDPARILLRDEFMWLNPTEDFGNKAVQLGSLRPAGGGGFATLEVEPPEMAEESALEDANQTIDDLRDEKERLEEKITRLKRHRDDAEEEAKQRREEVREELQQLQRELAISTSISRRGRSASTVDAVDVEPLSENGDSLSDIESEYLDDD